MIKNFNVIKFLRYRLGFTRESLSGLNKEDDEYRELLGSEYELSMIILVLEKYDED